MKTILMGQGSLALQCANAVANEGYDVIAVCSSDERLRQWATDRSIPIHSLTELEALEADYLFSIVNYRIVPTSLLGKLRRFGVNYHDALLPRYAGTHATSWAILNREREHGITWHVMTERVDAGDILKQTSFEITENETALSLNYKCFYAALKSFRELIAELRHGNETRVPQALEHRTYYPSQARPECLISFEQTAQDIYRLWRALYFGSYPNPLGAPTMTVDDKLHAVESVECTEHCSEAAPGTILSADGNKLLIATATTDIRVTTQ